MIQLHLDKILTYSIAEDGRLKNENTDDDGFIH
jgi:hypothetical protein